MKKLTITTAIVLVSLFMAQAVFAGTVYVTKGGYIASISENYLKTAMTYAAQGDEVAFNKMERQRKIFVMKEGIRVYISDTKFFSGIVKIRVEGDTIEVWTLIDAIEEV